MHSAMALSCTACRQLLLSHRGIYLMKQSNTDNRRLRIKESNDILKQRVRVKARQRNHESYCLPTILSHLPPMPLYMAVAHYALLKRVPVSRQTISAEFCISTRRALEVLRYLFNAQKGVMCSRLAPLLKGDKQGYRIRVHAISSKIDLPANEVNAAFNPRSCETSRGLESRINKSRDPRDERHTYQDMRRWFLQRPNVE